ncbi:hypothetical protein MMC26_001919 [Xylographa opegraphella]|nr:hypothetical protein [Xylographa opegraphella]
MHLPRTLLLALTAPFALCHPGSTSGQPHLHAREAHPIAENHQQQHLYAREAAIFDDSFPNKLYARDTAALVPNAQHLHEPDTLHSPLRKRVTNNKVRQPSVTCPGCHRAGHVFLSTTTGGGQKTQMYVCVMAEGGCGHVWGERAMRLPH